MIVQQMMTKKTMCDKAGLQFPSSTGAQNSTFPCNITEAEYTNRINSCSDKLLKMWKANKADPGTCKEYKTTKACVYKVIQDGGCNTAGQFGELIKLSLGKYNPFCADDVDPTEIPPTSEPASRKSTVGTTSVSPETSVPHIISLLSVLLVIILVV